MRLDPAAGRARAGGDIALEHLRLEVAPSHVAVPPPAIRSGHVMLWRWGDVVEWVSAAGIPVRETEERRAAVVRAANALLDARRAVALLDETERASLGHLVA